MMRRNGRSARLGIGLLGGCAALLQPSSAAAHLMTTGLGPVYDGISHVLMTLSDLVPILTLSMLAGLNGPAAGRRILFLLTGAWLVGGLAGYVSDRTLVPTTWTIASFLVLGGLTALGRRLALSVVSGLGIAVGLLHGWMNGAGIAAAERAALGLVGIVSAIFVLVAIVSAFVVTLRARWMQMAVRVVGSWVAAIGLLMLGWSLRGVL